MRLFGIDLNFPVTDPVWIFLIVLVIILFAPLLLNKLRIPHIIGMILAGVLIGEYGLNILERDSSFELFGQVGLYYIMFLAGLEMDMEDFRKNKVKGLVFGLLTFFIPMALGIITSMEMLGFSFVSSVLLASMYASHTLIAYPIVSRYGLSRQRSVTISIGGTAVTVTLALVVLALISGMYNGAATPIYWIMLVLKVTLICLVIVFVFPMLGRIFFRKYDDAVMQFVFVLALVFLGGGLISLAGMEGILGAFLVGLVLNPLVPKVSPLMNRLEFVGNALFIPYFLIGVGMIIDVRTFVAGGSALKVAVVMTVVATLSKWIAAYATQKIYRMSANERKMIFGLSNAQAAATLAAVLVGHEIIMENGERLLNDDVLNGTVVMILITCIISTIETERASRKFAMQDSSTSEDVPVDVKENILIPVANPDTIEYLVNLALVIRDNSRKDGIVALNVINDSGPYNTGEQGQRYLEKAAMIASAADVKVNMVSRYDLNIASGIIHTVKEYGVTGVVIGLHQKAGILDSFFGSLTASLLKGTFREVIVARLMMPVNTLKGIVVVVPPKAEYETGFIRWVTHLCRMSSQTGCHLRFRADSATAQNIETAISGIAPGVAYSMDVADGVQFAELMSVNVKSEQLLVVVKARSGSVSYDPAFDRLPALLNKDFPTANLMVIYPEQVERPDVMSFSDPRAN
ncbi:MAG: cation:proton antiporter [Bacteroidetes bacterium]|uniref:Cation:proton antiporter n=1 Tax=Candidatus Cryptobacteroides faecigallinarum TaxID=2840763 RepID=A0A9D9IN10_9BACT|nr:cation:proton antiporter [Candidatus Cryptobacteroides faecigallinarum]